MAATSAASSATPSAAGSAWAAQRRAEGQLAADHGQDIAGHPGLEAGRARRCDAITLVSMYSSTASSSSAADGSPKGGSPRRSGSPSAPPAGSTPSRPRMSHSHSQTRRPMAASSTERVGPAQVGRGLQRADHRPLDRGVHLPPAHLVDVHRPPAGRCVGGQKARRAHRIHRPGPGRRTARPSHTASRCPRPGCPRWASSQSSTPRRPWSSTRKFPIRKSPWTTVGSPPAGPARANHRAPSSRTGRCSCSASRKASGSPQWIGIGQPGDGSGVDRVDGGQGAAVCPVRRCGPGELHVAQDPSGDGLALEAFDHQPAGIEPVRGAGGHHPGTGTPARWAARSRPASISTPGCRVNSIPRTCWRTRRGGPPRRPAGGRMRW